MPVSELERSASTGALAAAIKTGLPRLNAASAAYQTEVCVVNTFVNNVLSAQLPTLPVDLPNWQAYVDAWAQARSTALQWADKCMAPLIDTPYEVTSYDTVIGALLADAINQTELLVQNPNDTNARSALDRDLSSLLRHLQQVQTFIAGAINPQQAFQVQLAVTASDLAKISNMAIADNLTEQAQIEALKDQISQLQAEIVSLTKALIALGVADAAALTFGAVSSLVGFPLTWLVMGPVVAVTSTFIALDAKQLLADKQAIEQTQSQMSQPAQFCAVLAFLSNVYAKLVQQALATQNALHSVLSTWTLLSGEMSAAINGMKSAISDADTPNYLIARLDLQNARLEWNMASTQASALTLNLNANAQPLQIGMSSEEVAAALAKGRSIDLMTYFNQLGQLGA